MIWSQRSHCSRVPEELLEVEAVEEPAVLPLEEGLLLLPLPEEAGEQEVQPLPLQAEGELAVPPQGEVVAPPPRTLHSTYLRYRFPPCILIDFFQLFYISFPCLSLTECSKRYKLWLWRLHKTPLILLRQAPVRRPIPLQRPRPRLQVVRQVLLLSPPLSWLLRQLPSRLE
jgi:hypothetical protein